MYCPTGPPHEPLDLYLYLVRAVGGSPGDLPWCCVGAVLLDRGWSMCDIERAMAALEHDGMIEVDDGVISVEAGQATDAPTRRL